MGQRPPGAYRLLNFPYDGQGGDMSGMAGMGSGPPAAMATIVYEGRAERSLGLPARLVPVEPLPPSKLPLRTFEFRSRAVGTTFFFQINGLDFDHHRVDARVELNTIEDWEIVNADLMDHPVHLHTNPFQILGADGQPERAWRDIINVRGGARQRFRVRFADYPGKTVYHCHRVAHGDLGMMQVIEMLDKRIPPRTRLP